MDPEIETLGFESISYEIDIPTMEKAFPYVKDLYNFIISNTQCNESEKVLDTSNKSYILLKYITRPMKKQFRKAQIVYMYRYYVAREMLNRNKIFENWIKAKATRSSSGIVNITFVFKPDKGSCEMDCDYCPNDPAVTRSYRLDEPAVARANRVKWDPVEQFNSRVQTLYNLGHEITKLEYIIEGGTFHSYSEEYVTEFIRDCYYAANVYLKPVRPRMSLEHEIQINETSDCPVIGLTIETRPDMITEKQIRLFRKLGVTRVQVGVQSIYDNVLRNLNRKCPTHKTIRGIYLLKQNCFKIDLHWMPDLPGSTFEADMLMFRWICGETITEKDINIVSSSGDPNLRELIGEQGIKILTGSNEILQGDQFKIYPTMVLPYTRIKEWYDRAKSEGAKVSNVQTSNDKKIYVPYAETDNGVFIDNLMTYILTHCPKQIRINRVVRDFVQHDILGGTDRLDLRNEISCKINKEGLCQTDIRAREVRSGKINILDSRVWIQKYRASEGTEYFISLENSDQTVLYGFIRLRFNDTWENVYFDCLKRFHCAYIRELHVYGNVVSIANKGISKLPNESSSGSISQHLGIGKFLIHLAEEIAVQNNFEYMAIIAGVGTREYYKKCGYEYMDTFMVKNILVNPVPCPSIWKSKIPKTIKSNANYWFILYYILIIVCLALPIFINIYANK